jgi:neutral ceramidase
MADVDSDAGWSIGRGIADITGEPWGVGMMGYGMRFQRTTGIHLRQRSRAFIIADRVSGRRVVFVVADIGMFFRNVRAAVLRRLDPSVYGEDNVVLTATHTHAGVAGYSCYRLYNATTNGFRPRTYDAIVDGVVASIEQADADLAPGRLRLARGQLHDASVNRSPEAFGRNPVEDTRHFPGAVDPATTLLRLERGGRLVGVVNWFATHGTSLTNRNTLISGDNKGYAAYHWEREASGDDHGDGAGFVAAFAQSNAGDMSPNVPDATHGPTDDEVDNARIIGDRQFAAAHALSAGPAADLAGGIDTRLSYVQVNNLAVDAAFTGDGRPHRTGSAVLGAAFAAGTKEGPGARFCHEGVDANRLLFAGSRAAFRIRPAVGDAQRPKTMLLPVGALGWTADRLPIQLVRIGSLVLVALAQEVTIVAGLRLRRAVADVLGVSIDDVLVQGYANDYAGYLTTPEEYDAQRYEGGHTMFGRWQLAAYVQEVVRIATDMRDGLPTRSVDAPQDRTRSDARRGDDHPPARCTGVSVQPADTYAPGALVRVEFTLTDPRGRVLPAYFAVERHEADGWRGVADDGDWATTIEWHERRRDGWVATVTWRVPAGASGSHRVSYLDGAGGHPTRTFTVA